MRVRSLQFLATIFCLMCATAAADQAADEAAIRANAEKYVEAYNRRDSKTMASMWSPDAVYQDPTTGEGVVGRERLLGAKVSDPGGGIGIMAQQHVAGQHGCHDQKAPEWPAQKSTSAVILIRRGLMIASGCRKDPKSDARIR